MLTALYPCVTIIELLTINTVEFSIMKILSINIIFNEINITNYVLLYNIVESHIQTIYANKLY